MKKVILTVGPRGSCKTTFCQKIAKERPDIVFISRDQISIEIFGNTSLNPYTGDIDYVMYIMWRRVKNNLPKSKDATLILDCWNGSPGDRFRICKKLREMGVNCIVAWHFIVTEKTCLILSKNKKDYQRDESDYRHDFRLFNSFLVDKNQGFDFIHKIDPFQLTIFPYSEFLL